MSVKSSSSSLPSLRLAHYTSSSLSRPSKYKQRLETDMFSKRPRLYTAHRVRQNGANKLLPVSCVCMLLPYLLELGNTTRHPFLKKFLMVPLSRSFLLICMMHHRCFWEREEKATFLPNKKRNFDCRREQVLRFKTCKKKAFRVVYTFLKAIVTRVLINIDTKRVVNTLETVTLFFNEKKLVFSTYCLTSFWCTFINTGSRTIYSFDGWVNVRPQSTQLFLYLHGAAESKRKSEKPGPFCTISFRGACLLRCRHRWATFRAKSSANRSSCDKKSISRRFNTDSNVTFLVSCSPKLKPQFRTHSNLVLTFLDASISKKLNVWQEFCLLAILFIASFILLKFRQKANFAASPPVTRDVGANSQN